MKKYIKPVSHVVKVDAENILAGSMTGTIGTGFSNSDDVGAKGYYDWDDEEDEDY